MAGAARLFNAEVSALQAFHSLSVPRPLLGSQVPGWGHGEDRSFWLHLLPFSPLVIVSLKHTNFLAVVWILNRSQCFPRRDFAHAVASTWNPLLWISNGSLPYHISFRALPIVISFRGALPDYISNRTSCPTLTVSLFFAIAVISTWHVSVYYFAFGPS